LRIRCRRWILKRHTVSLKLGALSILAVPQAVSSFVPVYPGRHT
jgi:hypothetical protein